MEVHFRRTGDRRYALTIVRKDLPSLEFNAPGYDPLMPHDLLHMIVESELGMTRGIFGFMAAGGDAGGAAQPEPGESSRAARRRRAKASKRDTRMLRRGDRDDGPRSERATHFFLWEWLRRSANPQHRKRAADMAAHSPPVLPDDERQALSEYVIERVCGRMDELSAKWQALEVGKSFAVEWGTGRFSR
jgi:hypothetical protein